MKRARLLFALACAGLTAQSFIACAGSGQTRDRDQQGRPIEDVSSVRPSPEALQQDRDVQAVARLKRVESVGDCAPRYRTGELGACINNKPCRGFGVIDDAGVISCTCYGKAGGCSENERCDDRKVACVPEDEPPFERAR